MAVYGSNFAPDHDACGVGFIAQLGGDGSHEVVDRALEALLHLAHRGGVDADGRSGDGTGLLTRIPEKFMRDRAGESGIDLPEVFGLGMIFLPDDQQTVVRALIEATARQHGLRCLGWRIVPSDVSILGPRASDTVPAIQQCFFAADLPTADLEWLLFVFRKHVEATAPPGTYFCSLSSRTVVYKGLLTPFQLPAFYLDLTDPDFISPFAIFHQRYSTNTQPSWSLAQPFRFVAHNGEINTIRANRRWLHTRRSKQRRHLAIPDEVRWLETDVSDSASFDNALEIFLRQGFRSEQALLAMVPPAWENNPQLQPELRRFLELQAYEQEPWDGPAALVFSDGITVGAKLDRNGLRPLRYTLTSDGLLVVGSEEGIADLHGKHVVERQRLGPGQMLLADPVTGFFSRPSEYPQLPELHQSEPLPATIRLAPIAVDPTHTPDALCVMAALGWTEDQYRLLFLPLVEVAQEAVWSMGDDTPPAFLSSLRRPLWDYCKQRFAQVTNPPIDPLRESHVMSLNVYLGRGAILNSPLLDAGEMQALRKAIGPVHPVDFTFPLDGGIEAARATIASLAQHADEIIAKKSRIVLLSDRNTNQSRAALPALLALAALWKSLMQAAAIDVPVVIETGQVIDTHHLALLVAAGAAGVFPYLALEEAARLGPDGAEKYRAAVETGLRKVLARMGISTISSYRNSQLFEVVGLDPSLCAEYFEDADYILGDKTVDDLLRDCVERHGAAFSADEPGLRDAGLYRFRHNGERHSSSPEVVRRMHRYIKSPSEETYRSYSELAIGRQPVSIRDSLEFVPAEPVSLHEVETEASLLSRFSTQAMSLGAISPEAHRTLAIAMNRLGGRSNTGEGGEDPEVYGYQSEANNRVKQVASGRFGVTTEYLVHADELEIKIAQGAKPGEGGQLPAAKVSPYIAWLRHAVPGMALISPPPHHDIYSIEDLAQLIYDLRAVNPHARIGVKLVSSGGVGIVAAGVAKAGADIITISGYDGGTGASPMTTIKNTGMPWEIGLRDAHRTLVRTGLRSRVRLRVDGGLKFARDVIFAALLGAEEFGFGTAALLAIGCVMARQCHLNTCPVGIASQDEHLRARFTGKPEMVETYFRGLAAEVRTLLAEMGARSIDEIVGAVERARPRNPEMASALANLLEPTAKSSHVAYPREDNTALYLQLNRAVDGLDTLAVPERRFRISNSDRAIGAHLSGEILRRIKPAEVVASPFEFDFVGTAGQSFGAFLVSGVNFRLTGPANDYVGKGLSGGSIAIAAGEDASQRGDVLAGNAVLYGATSGELFVAGRAGERFAVRNSGALAVVEGVGQHGCEYMTAGVVVILGPTGTNFAAGMTGGLAYLMREHARDSEYNQNSVRLRAITVKEELWLRRVLRRHLRLTGSPQAAHMLSERSLSLQRVEPVKRPCSVTETWAPVLKRLRMNETPKIKVPLTVPSDGPVIM